jgi:hypothetical protein
MAGRRMRNLPELAAEALAADEPCAIHEFVRTDALAAFDSYGFELQSGAIPANDLDGGIAYN